MCGLHTLYGVMYRNDNCSYVLLASFGCTLYIHVKADTMPFCERDDVFCEEKRSKGSGRNFSLVLVY